MSLVRPAPLKSRILLTGLTLAVSLAGCVSSHVLVGTPRPPIQPSEVRAYLQPKPSGNTVIAVAPERGYEERIRLQDWLGR